MDAKDWLTAYALNQAAEWDAECGRLTSDLEYAQQQRAYWQGEAKEYETLSSG